MGFVVASPAQDFPGLALHKVGINSHARRALDRCKIAGVIWRKHPAIDVREELGVIPGRLHSRNQPGG